MGVSGSYTGWSDQAPVLMLDSFKVLTVTRSLFFSPQISLLMFRFVSSCLLVCMHFNYPSENKELYNEPGVEENDKNKV